jgi:hypothetical protein
MRKRAAVSFASGSRTLCGRFAVGSWWWYRADAEGEGLSR